MTIGQTRTNLVGMVLFGLATLAASGLAGAHGAPELDGVPAGIVKAHITERADIAGLSAMILDAPRPGILLRYNGDTPLTVLGLDGEDFLRFTRSEVAVNINSPSWKALPNSTSLADTGELDERESDQAAWVTLSQSGNFAWLDPRLDVLKDAHEKREPQAWSIALALAGGEPDHIGGLLTFTPY